MRRSCLLIYTTGFLESRIRLSVKSRQVSSEEAANVVTEVRTTDFQRRFRPPGLMACDIPWSPMRSTLIAMVTYRPRVQTLFSRAHQGGRHVGLQLRTFC